MNMDDAPNPEDVIIISPPSKAKLTRLDNQGTNATDIRYSKTTISKPVTSKNITPLANPPISYDELVNQPVYSLSLAQIADLSPNSRTQLKAALTKPHTKAHVRTKGSSTHLLIGEPDEEDKESFRVEFARR
jgi:hypothetical protein